MSDDRPNHAGTEADTQPPPTGDEVFNLVKETVERMDRLGVTGMIEVRWMTHVAGAGSVTMRGKSDGYVKLEAAEACMAKASGR